VRWSVDLRSDSSRPFTQSSATPRGDGLRIGTRYQAPRV
jgi:hypothetical protein